MDQNSNLDSPAKSEAEQAKSLSAASALLLFKALLILVPCVILVATGWSEADTFGRVFAAALGGFGLYVLAASLLLNKRKRLGRVLAWTVLPIFLLGFPIGTLLSGIIIVKMEDGKSLLK